jgi:hypothetical protein
MTAPSALLRQRSTDGAPLTPADGHPPVSAPGVLLRLRTANGAPLTPADVRAQLGTRR